MIQYTSNIELLLALIAETGEVQSKRIRGSPELLHDFLDMINILSKDYEEIFSCLQRLQRIVVLEYKSCTTRYNYRRIIRELNVATKAYEKITNTAYIDYLI